MVKIKNRYYLIRLITNDGNPPNVRGGQIFGELMKLTCEMFGDIGYSIVKMSLSVRVTDEDVAVVRVASSGERYVSAVLPFLLKIGNEPMVLSTLFIGRSIRSCEKRLLKIRRDELHSALGKCKTPATRMKILDAIKNICGKPARIFDDCDTTTKKQDVNARS